MPKKSHFILKALLFSLINKISRFFLIIVSFILLGCGAGKPKKSASIQLRLIDDYIIPDNQFIGNEKIGGLSGIDFDGEKFYVVCDAPSKPRIYKFNIKTSSKKIDTIIFEKQIKINTSSTFLKNNRLDLESILFHPKKNTFTLSSEGAINNQISTSLFTIDDLGNYIFHYQLPSYFTAEGDQRPRHNRAFESLSHSINKNGTWVATELPLTKDGPKPKLYRTKSPVRFTYFNETNEATFQFSYLLEPIQKIPFLPFYLNGVTDILEIAPKEFLVLERAFSAGRGKLSYDALLFKANASKATNTLAIKRLKRKEIISADKELIFNFKSIRKQLKHKRIDNLEGICFGPQLPNGNATIFVISDNNFNSFMNQINQVIWLEIIKQ